MKKSPLATLIALAVLFISVSTPVWSATPQENFQKDKTRRIAGLYFAFPGIMFLWANSCGNAKMKESHEYNETRLNLLAKKLNLKLDPATNTVSDRKSAGDLIVKYLMIAWQGAASYRSALPNQALSLGMTDSTLMMTLGAEKLAELSASKKAEILKNFDEMIASSKQMGIPKGLTTMLESAKSIFKNAKTDAEVTASLDKVIDWSSLLIVAFDKK
ncbi:MAG: hypothetical protein WCI57_02655 [Candidatus Berkelbacteria bacterium]